MPGVRAALAPKQWFEDAFGFVEKENATTKSMFDLSSDGLLVSKANNKTFHAGQFDLVTLENLVRRADEASLAAPDDFMMAGDLTFENIVADTRELYGDAENADAVFQVSSLYNCLETNRMCHGGLRKEDGVTRYADHAAQGPASAISCPAATVYRHYFANEPEQLDCLSEVGKQVNNEQERYWVMREGYCEPYVPGSISKLGHKISRDPSLAASVKAKLQVGVHWDTEVWTGSHRACQVFCSGLPVCDFKSSATAADWEGFARAVLEAAFDATLTVALVLAAERGSRVKVYITPVGGGVLGNRRRWIVEAIDKALTAHRKEPLDVYLVHYAHVPEDGFRDLESGRKASAEETLPLAKRKKEKTITRHAAEMSKQLERDEQQRLRLKSASESVRLDDFSDDLLPPCQLAQTQNKDAVRQLMRLFATYDVNGDGYVEKRAFQDMLQHVAPGSFPPGIVELLVASADANDSGSIHYAEFVAWVFDESVITDSLLRVSSAHTGSCSRLV